jgi:hypothetical protein
MSPISGVRAERWSIWPRGRFVGGVLEPLCRSEAEDTASPAARHVVECADVRLIELGNRACLAVKALSELRVSGERLRENLDGDGAIQTRVSGLVDLSHPPGVERAEDFVRTEAGAGRQRHEKVYVSGLYRWAQPRFESGCV